MEWVAFAVVAAGAIVCAVGLVVRPNPLHGALFLVGNLFCVAVLYLMLGAEFLALAQVVVYAGAIMVLFIFVIMLLNAGAETKKGRSYLLPGAPLLIVLLGLLAYYVQRMFPGSTMVRFGGFQGGGPKDIGTALFTTYLLPFEVTSILILVAIIGAIVLARKEID
jgi:NADH-quinone oxidoreductase subunit J